MSRYGFVIDNTRCIGCHACSTACKSENEVPLGVYRTWVKYVETGRYPDSRRHFQVTRCNHCENPPCARICPVQAMYQRADGIVEFDKDICIGCKACMQACPYDAIHIDPDTGTAAKCHYCSHRTELGMEPACVVVCPTQAIAAGDMDDPATYISHVLARKKTTVRKPEQGTAPKLFYVEGLASSLHPTATERTPQTFMWADVMSLHEPGVHEGNGHGHGAYALAVAAESGKTAHSGTPIQTPKKQGVPRNPVPSATATQAGQMLQVVYNAQHKIPWHWPVPAYLVTKAIGAGVFMMLALYFLLFKKPITGLTATVAGLVSLAFLGLTTVFLIIDLEKPMRFLSILLRPQFKSWLTRGAFILVGFSGLVTIWWALEAAAWLGIVAADMPVSLRVPLLLTGIPLAIGAAIYTGFLFAQAEGRDLWQSALLPFHLLVQALMMGGAALLVVPFVISGTDALLTSVAHWVFGITLVLDLFVVLFGEFGVAHASEVAGRAAKEITHGRYKNHFWIGAILLGHIVPFALLFAGSAAAAAGAGLLAITGLYFYEHAFVMAPQEIPNS